MYTIYSAMNIITNSYMLHLGITATHSAINFHTTGRQNYAETGTHTIISFCASVGQMLKGHGHDKVKLLLVIRQKAAYTKVSSSQL